MVLQILTWEMSFTLNLQKMGSQVEPPPPGTGYSTGLETDWKWKKFLSWIKVHTIGADLWKLIKYVGADPTSQ
jgi:hypothetical protein